MKKTVFNIIEFTENETFNQANVTSFTVSNFGASDLDLVFSTGVRIPVPKYDAVNLHARSFGFSDHLPFDIKFTVEFTDERGKAVLVYNQLLTTKEC